MNQKPGMSKWMIKDLMNKPELRQIVRDVEAKYQAEYERAAQWMEENDIIAN